MPSFPIWSAILNRKDVVGQKFWTEWRTNAVVVGGTPAQAGDVVLLDPNGKIDPSLLPAIPSGLLIEVNGVPTIDQNVLNLIAGLNIVLTPDALGGVTIATTTELDGTFDLDDGFILLGSSDFDFNDGDII